MEEPRFKVGAVTGWPITPQTLHSSRALKNTPTSVFYVLDSAYCYRQVAVFYRSSGLARAEALAAKLNAEHEEEMRKLREEIPF